MPTLMTECVFFHIFVLSPQFLLFIIIIFIMTLLTLMIACIFFHIFAAERRSLADSGDSHADLVFDDL